MRGLKTKILLYTLLPLSIILVLMGGLTVYNKAATERELLLQRLSAYRTLLESGQLSLETSADKTQLEAFFNEKVVFSEIIGKEYQVIYSSENSAAPLINQQDKEDVDDAFRGYETTKTVKAKGGQETAFVIITPLIVNNKVAAVLHQGLSNERSTQRILEYGLYTALAILIGISMCFVAISFLLDNTVLKNIYRLKKATLDIQKGNLDSQITVSTDDEVGELSTTFNQMTRELKASRKKLEDYSQTLEEKVNQRTLQLNAKNQELERFNKMAVGRELKMIELKKTINELTQKIEQITGDPKH